MIIGSDTAVLMANHLLFDDAFRRPTPKDRPAPTTHIDRSCRADTRHGKSFDSLFDKPFKEPSGTAWRWNYHNPSNGRQLRQIQRRRVRTRAVDSSHHKLRGNSHPQSRRRAHRRVPKRERRRGLRWCMQNLGKNLGASARTPSFVFSLLRSRVWAPCACRAHELPKQSGGL